uniref:glycoside hydrolase family 3 N-terminal domain-containing protein n=1 Tax=uncultured Dysosmobacter sp. TaxID=2591384 RepID=UPI002606E753
MKRIIPFLLVLLLLAGCAVENSAGNTNLNNTNSNINSNNNSNGIAPPPEDGEDNQSPGDGDEDKPPAGADPRAETVEAILASMSLEEKVGQMFFVRCPAAGAVEDISAYHLGGYILFGQDFKDAAGTWLTGEQFMGNIASYQAAAKISLLIGVDEEGGTVARASRNPNLFPAVFKSPQKVFAAGGLEAVRRDALEKSAGLLALGINVNLAPVADVSVDPADFIYDRAFGQDAAATAEYVETVVSAANQVSYESDGRTLGIGSVLKHFPGYGNNVDTHTGIAIDEREYSQFESQDFLPFQAGIRAGAGG